jgi:hypothetical protein
VETIVISPKFRDRRAAEPQTSPAGAKLIKAEFAKENR